MSGRRVGPWLLAAVLGAAGCGSSALSSGSGAVANPGTWQGSDLQFTLNGSTLSEVVLLSKLTCQGDNGCQGSVTGPLTGTVTAAPLYGTLQSSQGSVEIDGQFTGATQASGTLRAQAGSCCTAVAVWSADWLAPPSGGGDAGSTPDSWGTSAGGTLKPYPPRAVDGSLAAPDGASPEQVAALQTLEQLRAKLGLLPVTAAAPLQQAAQAHAEFFVAHGAQYQAKQLSPHAEDPSFGSGFTGADPQARIQAAGWSAPATEIMAFTGSPTGAIAGWLATVYHRMPLLDPRSKSMGYGQAAKGAYKTEVMEVSGGASAAPGVVVYPYPGQTGVPGSWDGAEGPQPPAPPKGFPSGPVISLRFSQPATVTKHELRDAAGTPLEHVWLDAQNDSNTAMFDGNCRSLYAHQPLAAGVYTVHVEATILGKAEVVEWQFQVGN
ncbi:MAG: hypothetical protein HY902_08300 [Deltaproteobacteria bacterium]|nr:hypothetical protein [Deltaproteobacteria bacterium]